MARDARSRITVLSWNIQAGRDVDDHYDLDRIVETIDRLEPDLVGLQEVDRTFRSRSGFDDQVAILAEELGMDFRFGGNVVLEPTEESAGALRRYGIATLTTPAYPIDDVQHYLLPKIEYADRYSERRGLLETTIDVDGRPLTFYNTHFCLTAEQRMRQATVLLEFTRRQGTPQVLVGDFNATPDSRPIDRVRTRYIDAAERADAAPDETFPADDPDRRIDYVFTTPEVTVVDVTVDPTAASDHRAIRATIEVAADDRFRG